MEETGAQPTWKHTASPTSSFWRRKTCLTFSSITQSLRKFWPGREGERLLDTYEHLGLNFFFILILYMCFFYLFKDNWWNPKLQQDLKPKRRSRKGWRCLDKSHRRRNCSKPSATSAKEGSWINLRWSLSAWRNLIFLTRKCSNWFFWSSVHRKMQRSSNRKPTKLLVSLCSLYVIHL